MKNLTTRFVVHTSVWAVVLTAIGAVRGFKNDPVMTTGILCVFAIVGAMVNKIPVKRFDLKRKGGKMMEELKEYAPFIFAGFSVGVAATALLCHTPFLAVAIQVGFILMAITFFWFAFETIKLEREISNEGDSEEFVESEV